MSEHRDAFIMTTTAGTLTISHDITRYTKAGVFAKVGKETEVLVCFSTAVGTRGDRYQTARMPSASLSQSSPIKCGRNKPPRRPPDLWCRTNVVKSRTHDTIRCGLGVGGLFIVIAFHLFFIAPQRCSPKPAGKFYGWNN
jgi:hypothetical protein